jgi:hypothetical protein
MRNSPGNVLWVRPLGLFMCKEYPLKFYKMKFALELVKWFLNGSLVKLMFFRNLYRKKNISPVQKMTKPRGNLLDILLGLGLRAL